MEKLAPGDPQRIGAYRLLARLGAGGMGHVYLARSDRGRTVAVKLVREELATQEEFRARFRQEVQAARRVGGHWTAPVLDADTEAVVPWVATGYVAGPSLQQVVGRDHGALPERSVRILAAGLAHALKDIHAAGIVHRDLKPSNVLVTIDGPRVIDFGIARALETLAGDGLTRTGSLVGSPGFMAPEQVRGDRITPACDVFCLGSVLAYAATGKLPFGAAHSGVHALMFRIAQEDPDLEGVPEGIADLVRDCLRKDPAARPTLDRILERTGAEDTVSGGRSRDPWLPGALVAQLGRHAVRLLEAEDPEGEAEGPQGPDSRPAPPPYAPGGDRTPDRTPERAAEPGPGGDRVPGPGGDRMPDPTPAWIHQQDPAPGQGHGPGQGQGHGPGQGPGQGQDRVPDRAPAASPEHAPASDDASVPPPPGDPRSAGRPGVNHLPTMVAGHTPPPGTPPAHPAYGYPQQHPQPSAYGHPQQPGAGAWPGSGQSYNPYAGDPYAGGVGSTPPYGPPPAGSTPSYGPGGVPPREPGRNGRSTALLVVVALVVALAAGGSVYGLMKGGGSDDKGGGTAASSPATGAPRTTGPTSSGPAPTTSRPTSSAPSDGAIPAGYLGTWESSIDNTNGHSTRELTIQQGDVGDNVLTLVADGPTDAGGTYHCVFAARLAEKPSGNGPLEMGPSTVTSGEPRSSCTPGEATEVTLLSDGRLRRAKNGSAESLTYTKR
ncbi:protein kinase [Streptomyces sp. NPDC086549]|uniref:serine/threonine-protein kinase n=1 Tax=Streptomyces sp. NPDC086549 TaxID=3365752 RepID=UPI003807B93B